jgi:integrase
VATVRRHRAKWQARVRLKGAKPVSCTFHRKADAERWGVETEARLQRGQLPDSLAQLRQTTLRQMLERYRDTVTVRKRGHFNETIRVNALLRQPFADESLASLSPQHFIEYRTERIRSVKPATVNRELTTLKHLFTVARDEWGMSVENPFARIRPARADEPRTRRLEKGEWESLVTAADECRNAEVRPVMEFAVETGMRRGEILGVLWDHVRADKRTLLIPTTKTGLPRTIPLSSRALVILEAQRAKGLALPCPLTVESFHMAWKRLIKRAGLVDFHFHDLRHEAVSRFFEMGLSVPEVALISGHKDFRMLARYTHLRAEDVATKLP